MHYRKEIDGLRALAVLPVILFHAGVPGFEGGFIGVDIFFTISGYLITALLLEDMTRGRFSLWSFYERRARRILPALLATVAVSAVFAWAWMLPSELADFAGSALALSVFASNVWFWQEAGYFAPASELQPLLHTWSLAVEEQFYLVFPLLLGVIWAVAPRRAMTVVALIAGASFLLCLWLTPVAPDAGFYLAPTRAWELLAGALCALSGPAPRRLRHRGDLAAAGLALLILGFVVIDGATPFPSIATLLPVAGTALIILYAQPGRLVGGLLAWRPLVEVGLLSYSAYLVHQPLFAFARIRSESGAELAPGLALLLVLLTFPLAWLSWRFVEQPFRGTAPLLPRRAPLLRVAAAALALVAGLGAAGYAARGWPNRLPQIAALETAAQRTRAEDKCWFKQTLDSAAASDCLDRPRSFILLGDSHALALGAELGQATSAAGLSQLTLTHHACLPVEGLVRAPATDRLNRSCAEFLASAFALIRAHPDTPVVLFSRWTLAIEGTRFNNGEGGHEDGRPVILTDGAGAPVNVARNIASRYTALSKTNPLIVIGPFPEAGWHVPSRIARAMRRGETGISLSIPAKRSAQREAHTMQVLRGLVSDRITLVHLAPLFCGMLLPERCVNYHGSTLFYSDDNHPAPAASERIARAVLLEIHRAVMRAPDQAEEVASACDAQSRHWGSSRPSISSKAGVRCAK